VNGFTETDRQSVWIERRVAGSVGEAWKGASGTSDGAVTAPKTLALAGERVRANQGAAGAGEQNVERFVAKALAYLAELAEELREGTHRPEAVKRVGIPKGP
jgi:hypothetical protein